MSDDSEPFCQICSTFERRLAEQKAKHEELIFQLKFQLKDLEHYAKQVSLNLIFIISN